MLNKKRNNNESLYNLKKELTVLMNKIPQSENELFIELMKNVWEKLFVIKKNQTPIDIHYVISYINTRMKNSKNKQHQIIWAEIYKMLLKTKDLLEVI
jgi:hypothetical protein